MKFHVIPNGSVTSPEGFTASGMHAGIKKSFRKFDVSLIYSETPAVAAGTFTTNQVKAWPLGHDLSIIRRAHHRAIIANSGNANCFNGSAGKRAVEMTLNETAKRLNVSKNQIFAASTGIIGRAFPIEKVRKAIPILVGHLSAAGGRDAARGILTTDTHPKEIAVRFLIDGKPVTVAAMAKGAGMVYPEMNSTGKVPHATMLCFLTTDAAISKPMLNQALLAAVEKTFNRIAIDNDQSTNDMVLILANGRAGHRKIASRDKRFSLFQEALMEVCQFIAKELVKDGEGVTHACELVVTGSRSREEAKRLCERIATSMLVKTMLAGGDPNWGRLLGAIGASRIHFSNRIDIAFNGVPILKNGREQIRNKHRVRQILQKKEFRLVLDLKQGKFEERFWMCDLTKFYVWINASYSS